MTIVLQARRKVWKSRGGGACSTVVGIICPPGWDRANCATLTTIWKHCAPRLQQPGPMMYNWADDKQISWSYRPLVA